jgi:hypothetical protein
MSSDIDGPESWRGALSAILAALAIETAKGMGVEARPF